ncbi:MAG: sigma-70 family RNA polymerase sigma factor [Burkholderiaceae bacterium]
MSGQSPDINETLTRVYREDAGGVLAVLIRQFRDFDLAEDALQDAMAEALASWRRDGPPRNGAAWLLTTARRRAIDRIRRAVNARDQAAQLALLNDVMVGAASDNDSDLPESEQPIPDERLRLVFTCCHPALNEAAQVALTLRTICGLSVPQIARAYLVSEATMAQRLVRAKNKIRAAAIPYEIPQADVLSERLNVVCDVIYLIFNEGFAASDGVSPLRPDLCAEAIRLGRILYQLMPVPEPGGLLALMMLHDARRDARVGPDNSYIPIAEQNRSQWDHTQIEQGVELLLHCLGQRRPGPFQVQAAISAVHAQAPDAGQTDWEQIAGLYKALYEMTPTAVVMLNRAVAVANAGQVNAGLDLLNSVADELTDYQPLYAARADLSARCDNIDAAVENYQQAIAMSANAAERDFLHKKLQAIRCA